MHLSAKNWGGVRLWLLVMLAKACFETVIILMTFNLYPYSYLFIKLKDGTVHLNINNTNVTLYTEKCIELHHLPWYVFLKCILPFSDEHTPG